MFFRTLTADEEKIFRKWARDNYRPGDPINGGWHIVTQSECIAMNRERALFVADEEVAS